MNLYTSYFAKHNRKADPFDDVAYMSIAVGNPRYGFTHKLIDIPALKPYGIFRVYHGEEYRIKYFERLDSYGVERIKEEIARLSEGHENVILMCHEKDKNECHRLMFSDWWFEKTGERIPEFSEVEKELEENKLNKQLTLFDI